MWYYKFLFKILLSILFSMDPVEILDHTVILLLILKNHHTDFHVAVPDHVPTNSVQVFQFLHSLTNIYVVF